MKLDIEPDDLRPLIQTIVDKTIERINVAKSKVTDGRIAYPESEAAALIGVASHALRDARLRGELNASRLGKRVVYQRSELLKYLANRKINP